jgi:hypothetical protein
VAMSSSEVPRRILGAVVVLHGIAHFAGTADLVARAGGDRSADLLAGAVTVSDSRGLQALAVAWAVLGLAMILAGVVTIVGAGVWPAVLLAASASSLMLCILALWAAVIGVVVNAVLIGIALAAMRRHAATRTDRPSARARW